MKNDYELLANALSEGCRKSSKFKSIFCSLRHPRLIHYVNSVSSGLVSKNLSFAKAIEFKDSLTKIYAYYEGVLHDKDGNFYGMQFNIFGKIITNSPLSVIKVDNKGTYRILVLYSDNSSIKPGELVEFTLNLDEDGDSEEQSIELYLLRNEFINKIAPIYTNHYGFRDKKPKRRRLKIERKPDAANKIKEQQAEKIFGSPISNSYNSILNYEAGIDKSTYNPSVLIRYKAKQGRHTIVLKKVDPDYERAKKYLIKYIKEWLSIVSDLKTNEILRKIIPDNIKVTTDKRNRLRDILIKAKVEKSSKGRPVSIPERNEKINSLKEFPVIFFKILIKNRD